MGFNFHPSNQEPFGQGRAYSFPVIGFLWVWVGFFFPLQVGEDPVPDPKAFEFQIARERYLPGALRHRRWLCYWILPSRALGFSNQHPAFGWVGRARAVVVTFSRRLAIPLIDEIDR